ncbi:DNA-binding protein modulo [Drosophila rhopaloa]|uniref:DNA-binding protein modulo n=1 Tax=Drosophila rhopaloa TaxID=1041015 RepID=A0A6P4EJY9_DRORH|nr:DNA-binding protein modulo [Drosophila rhopaloa]
MAQKKAVAAKAKKAVNGVEKQVAKRGAKATKVQDEEEIVVAQSPAKKSRKQPVKDVPQSSEEESDAEEQNGDQAEDDSDSEAEEAEDYIDDEAEEEDEDDSDDDVEPGEVSKSEAAEEDEDSDDDNESPVEEPVAKKGKETKTPGKSTAEETEENGGIPKIRVGRIPPGTPKNQTIYATNLPNEYKHKEVVAVFAKFGPISALHRVKTKEGVNSVIIAFDSPASAEAALQAKPKALTLEDNVLKVSQLRNKESFSERTVVVGLIGLKVTKEDVKANFEKVASVESVTLSANRTNPVAFVRLASVDDVPKALKLNSTELFSRFITVRELSYKDNHPNTNETTLVVENLGKHESFSSDALEKIFRKFGEVAFVDIVCSKSVLAFVTFKHSEAATKALTQLQGKTVNNVELKLQRFERNSAARTILVTNLSSDTTEADLRDLFKESGKIESIQMLGIKAVVKFTDDDGFCKSFLANERIVNNQPIFIEPNSHLRYRLMKKRSGTGHSYAPAKFQKNVNNNFGKKPFNKRPAQEFSRKPFVKRAKF